jgi:predicted  nucleic acid-binding Zn-ribbon protein
MAAANESQGLKIAVAAFVSLTVILAVTSYFLYSNYDKASQQLTAAEEKTRTAQKTADEATRQYDDMKKQIGSRVEEYEAVKAEIAAERKKIDDDLASIGPMVVEMVSKVQAAGGANPALDEVKTNAVNLSTAYASDPNKTFLSSLARVKDLLKNQAKMTAILATNYTELKRSLEAANTINKQQMDVVVQSRDSSKADLESEQAKHVQARADLHNKVTASEGEIENKSTEIASLKSEHRQYVEETTKSRDALNLVVRDLRDEKSKTENVLDRPDGRVTFVDYSRGEVRTNITYGMGARPQMKMTIFDQGSPGIPTEKPKGTIELIYVGDKYSIARIDQTRSTIDPIRPGDIVYSPAWSPNEPMRFALIGKMDINRDGKDDRADLIRMIEAAGGIVDYDLPPPEAGKERGEITGYDSWYVVDDPEGRPPLVAYQNRREDLGTAENADFFKQRSNAIRKARDNGVRPMLIGRLLNYLGYTFNAPVRGRAEAIDQATMKGLLQKQTDAAKPKPPAEGTEATKEETPTEKDQQK